jgi:hypothetical protein
MFISDFGFSALDLSSSGSSGCHSEAGGREDLVLL